MGKQNLNTLVRISRTYGRGKQFVLAGGGNTSFKDKEHLYIKASGVSLAEIDEQGFVCLSREALARLWTRSYSSDTQNREAEVLADLLAARLPGEEAKRPSVETPLHDLLDYPYVVHTHPALINGLACSKQGKSAADRLFGNKVLWAPTVNPGYILAAKVREEVSTYREFHHRDPDILILQNHGLCVAGNSYEEIKKKTDYVAQTIQKAVSEQADFSPVEFDRQRAVELAPAVRMLLMGSEGASIVTFHSNTALAAVLADERAYSEVSTSVTPDHIVYCNAETLFVPARLPLDEQYRVLQKSLEGYRQSKGYGPKIIAVEKLGVFAWGSSKRSADDALEVFLDAVRVSVIARSFGGIQLPPRQQIDFIESWEAERFRKRVSAGQREIGRVAEKIAVVTGAAQGFGLGIAEALVREGANTVLADLNARLAEQMAEKLVERYGRGRARAEAVDVTEEQSLRDLIAAVVLNYGGVDLFVSNAGVLRAGGLEEMDLATFEFVNRVNYTAYYMCCRQVSPTMKIQHRFRSGYFMDIVQINSKSGLSGSNKNFAYAGSKFGSIGLTQSFALELIQHNIKVNSICPGNFFDGPLWSDPEQGLFFQYLRAGKVPGAKSIEDVRRYYEAKVPMKRGCTIEDVARALLYLVEQNYETGQALPVTGGQIMLK